MTAHTLTLSDSLALTESLERSGNNINLGLAESMTISVVLTEANFIVRSGDTAFIRTDIP